MKKIITLALGLIALQFNVFAQTDDQGGLDITNPKKEPIKNFNQKGFHLGTTVGLNLIFILNQNSYKTPEMEYRPTFGVNGGLAGGYNFNNFIGLQTEILLSQQGQKYKDEYVGQPVMTREVKSSYLQIPLMVKYMSGQSTVQFYIMGGPQLSVLNTSSVTYNGQEWTPEMKMPGIKKSSFYERYELGAKLAMGTDIKLSSTFYMNAGFAFYTGLTDMNIPEFRTRGNEFEVKPYKMSTNAYTGINVGVHYRFKK
jgi:hypothetical protein